MHNLREVFINTIKPYLAKSVKRNSPFFDVGFHGDRYVLALVDSLLQRCDYFVETGASIGSTLAYVARTYPEVHCISCEPNNDAFRQASKHIATYQNVALYNETSQNFLEHLRELPPDSEVLYWLDAHGYGFKWPLNDEVKFITTFFDRAFILIDDFKVPGLSCFGYDEYRDEICSFDYIKDALNKKRDYSLYYPQYTDVTSDYHPLRGWGLIEFGHSEDMNFPGDLIDKIKPAQTISF